ncbi:hypothetical protein HMI55_000616 [Coelomomyces lativittatus]|nr:hypothetical protein HMI55_000616 [Coelomomyces lativittatus]
MPEWFKNAFNTKNLKRRNDDVIEESDQFKRQKHSESKSIFSKETSLKNGEELNNVHYFFDSAISPPWFKRCLPSSLISSIVSNQFSQFNTLAYPLNSYDNKYPVSFIPLSDLSAQKQHSQIPLTVNVSFPEAPLHRQSHLFPWFQNEIHEYESQEQESFDRFLTAFQRPFWTVQVSN